VALLVAGCWVLGYAEQQATNNKQEARSKKQEAINLK
jgi:hypothetical protein